MQASVNPPPFDLRCPRHAILAGGGPC